MPTTSPHYLKDEPQKVLWSGGSVFSLFYDYDQIRDRKLTSLTAEQKAMWFCARIDMTFLEPLRRIFKEPYPSEVFNELMDTSSETPRSFSIAIMSVMVNGVESLGSFLKPKERSNQKRFEAFIKGYMPTWWGQRPGGKPLIKLLWKNFRNGIAHGFCITPPGSLEFLQSDPFQWDGQLLKVCPTHFFKDLEIGARTYFTDLKSQKKVLSQFIERFNSVYPT